MKSFALVFFLMFSFSSLVIAQCPDSEAARTYIQETRFLKMEKISSYYDDDLKFVKTGEMKKYSLGAVVYKDKELGYFVYETCGDNRNEGHPILKKATFNKKYLIVWLSYEARLEDRAKLVSQDAIWIVRLQDTAAIRVSLPLKVVRGLKEISDTNFQLLSVEEADSKVFLEEFQFSETKVRSIEYTYTKQCWSDLDSQSKK